MRVSTERGETKLADLVKQDPGRDKRKKEEQKDNSCDSIQFFPWLCSVPSLVNI